MNRIVTYRGILLVIVASVAGCVATPLPLPPELDTSRMELWTRGQEQVLFVGLEGALQPPMAQALLVTNLNRDEAVHFMTEATGAFGVGLAGQLGDTYRFAVLEEAGLEALLDCTSVGFGGVRDIDDEPPEPDPTDNDGDGFPVGEDCDDNNATVGPASPEICDSLDNDCDGEIDEEGCGCAVNEDCSDTLFCTGEESCNAGTCQPGVGVVCDDGDPTTLDYCSEVSQGCVNE